MAVIATALNEVSHHGSQICTLRDLYRITNGRRLSTERMDTVPGAVEKAERLHQAEK